MLDFKNWFLSENATLGTELVIDQISADYNKARYAIDLVRAYDGTKPDVDGNVLEKRKLLPNIGTIAKLAAGPTVFGLFQPAEDHTIISAPKQQVDQINKFFKGKALVTPQVLVKKYFPNLQQNALQQSSVIRINVPKIVNRFGDSPESIIEIAKTIVHEATHELERQITGSTKDGPGSAVLAAEDAFVKWLSGPGKNIFTNLMKQAFPGQPVGQAKQI